MGAGAGASAESGERVEWTETRNLATEHGERAARIMAATAEAAPELKRLAGGAATGRKLEKPVCHYSLNWAKEEKPARQEMSRAARERVVDGRGHSGGRWRRERMSPQREPREVIPAEREGPERERVAWQRAEERTQWERIQRWREKDLGKLERLRRCATVAIAERVCSAYQLRLCTLTSVGSSVAEGSGDRSMWRESLMDASVLMRLRKYSNFSSARPTTGCKRSL